MRKYLDAIWPDHCVLCTMALRPRHPNLLCENCWHDLPWLQSRCHHCATPLVQSGICGACLSKPLTRGKAVVPLTHTHEAQYLVQRLKFHHGYREAQTLAACLGMAVYTAYHDQTLPDALVATPMSWRNHIRRGYNQAELLTHWLAKTLQLPIIKPLRRKHGAPQRTLNRAARNKLNGASFPLVTPVRYPHIAVIDDVLTSGSTVRAIADVLQGNGARRVDVWCATRAVATVGDEYTL